MKRFVSDASHELRTPLAAIHGYAVAGENLESRLERLVHLFDVMLVELVVDEAHYIKNPSAKRSVSVMKLSDFDY